MTESNRFWSKVVKTENCWIWNAAKSVGGYGRFRYPKRHEYAHRVSYRLTNGEIPEGLQVLHKCDTPACVRPSHLFLGTISDNINDSVKKGRWGYRGHPGNQFARKRG